MFLNIRIYFIILKTYDQQFSLTTSASVSFPAPLYPLQDFKALYKYCIIIYYY